MPLCFAPVSAWAKRQLRGWSTGVRRGTVLGRSAGRPCRQQPTYSVEKLDRDALACGSRRIGIVERARIDDRRLGKGSMTPANATWKWISEFFNRIDPNQAHTPASSLPERVGSTREWPAHLDQSGAMRCAGCCIDPRVSFVRVHGTRPLPEQSRRRPRLLPPGSASQRHPW